MVITVTRIIFSFIIGFVFFMQNGCATSNKQVDNFPSKTDFPGYELIDARYTETLHIALHKNKKFAVVVKDLSVTAYSNLETPRYDKSYVSFKGSQVCCAPKEILMGASGLRVYKFQTLTQSGESNIDIIARHKGLDVNKDHYNNDNVTKIELTVR